ncbi:MAG: hypothetical protein HYV16_02675 [Gammaproteobacteria bacterium]|nr:hypothetical protein [Gammaproteobacteria bacterium]
MNSPLPPNPFAGLWLAHFTGLAGLAELPAQLLGGAAQAQMAASPQALAARLATNLELTRQFVTDWRPVLAAVAVASEADWQAVYAREGERVAAQCLAGLRTASALVLQGLSAGVGALPGAADDRGFGEAVAALVEVYLGIAACSLAAFRLLLADTLEGHELSSHEQLLALWQEATGPVHQAALVAGLPAAYGRCINRFNALFAVLQAGGRA